MPHYPISSVNFMRKSNGYANMVSSIVTIFIIILIIFGYIIVAPDNSVKDLACKYMPTLFLCHIIDTTSVQINQDLLSVGLSTGHTAFDLHSLNSQDKQQAATEMNAGQTSAAIQAWQNALTAVTDDAESLIYLEDAQIIASHQPYMTIVAATTLSETPDDNGTSVSIGRDDLRGIYIAQHTFNTQHSNLKLRVVIANLGINNSTYLAQTEPLVLQRIARLAASDATFIGVIGFSFSTAAYLAIPFLSQHHISIISPTASATTLTSLSSYFFRIVPSNAQQGSIAAQFASQVLGARHIAIFSDKANAYSSDLGNSFAQTFQALNHSAISISFVSHNADSMTTAVSQIAHANLDLIFVAGYADDIDHLKTQLAQDNISIEVMGGDAAYELGGYTKSNYRNLYFTSFTYPGTWNILCPSSSCGEVPSAADPKTYAALFDPHNQYTGQYGYQHMGSHVLLSYDATNTLLFAATAILSSNLPLQLDSIQQAIGRVSFQGASGLISFQGGNPVDKTILILCVDNHLDTRLVHVYGKFAGGATSSSFDSSYVRNSLCA